MELNLNYRLDQKVAEKGERCQDQMVPQVKDQNKNKT